MVFCSLGKLGQRSDGIVARKSLTHIEDLLDVKNNTRQKRNELSEGGPNHSITLNVAETSEINGCEECFFHEFASSTYRIVNINDIYNK